MRNTRSGHKTQTAQRASQQAQHPAARQAQILELNRAFVIAQERLRAQARALYLQAQQLQAAQTRIRAQAQAEAQAHVQAVRGHQAGDPVIAADYSNIRFGKYAKHLNGALHLCPMGDKMCLFVKDPATGVCTFYSLVPFAIGNVNPAQAAQPPQEEAATTVTVKQEN